MIELFLIRHGQTDWNVQCRLQGHTDIPLNENGRRQASALKKVLLPHSIEVFLTSDLSRAIETAELAKPHKDIAIIQHQGLREAALGKAEGLFFEDLHLQFPDAYKRWLSNGKPNEDFAFPEGESKLQHRERLENTLLSLLDAHAAYKKIAIVSHGGSMRRILEMCRDFSETEFRTANTSVYKILFKKNEKTFSFIEKLYSP
ncbi:MAG: histidine phosphatase family protein [Bdellovibrionota bacterium]